jgi:hypothetical protein
VPRCQGQKPPAGRSPEASCNQHTT